MNTRRIYIFYLGDVVAKNLVGQSRLNRLVRLGYVASSLILVAPSMTGQLRIYRESGNLLADISVSICQKAVILYPKGMSKVLALPALEPIGAGCREIYRRQSRNAQQSLREAEERGILRSLSYAQFQGLWLQDISNTTYQELSRSLEVLLMEGSGVLRLAMEGSVNPLVKEECLMPCDWLSECLRNDCDSPCEESNDLLQEY